jgi:hypothetical protein
MGSPIESNVSISLVTCACTENSIEARSLQYNSRSAPNGHAKHPEFTVPGFFMGPHRQMAPGGVMRRQVFGRSLSSPPIHIRDKFQETRKNEPKTKEHRRKSEGRYSQGSPISPVLAPKCGVRPDLLKPALNFTWNYRMAQSRLPITRVQYQMSQALSDPASACVMFSEEVQGGDVPDRP